MCCRWQYFHKNTRNQGGRISKRSKLRVSRLNYKTNKYKFTLFEYVKYSTELLNNTIFENVKNSWWTFGDVREMGALHQLFFCLHCTLDVAPFHKTDGKSTVFNELSNCTSMCVHVYYKNPARRLHKLKRLNTIALSP